MLSETWRGSFQIDQSPLVVESATSNAILEESPTEINTSYSQVNWQGCNQNHLKHALCTTSNEVHIDAPYQLSSTFCLPHVLDLHSHQL